MYEKELRLTTACSGSPKAPAEAGRKEYFEMDTKFSSGKDLVIQLIPDQEAGEITVHGIKSKHTAVWVFIPKPDGYKIYCPFNYFQDSCSLTEQWIYDDKHQKTTIEGINNLKKVIITIKSLSTETEINISEQMKCRLLDYLKFDISRNLSRFRGFDCHAFVCFLIDLKCIPEIPCFKYKNRAPEIGEVVVLCDRENLPESIQHWAIYLGNNLYLSKFGESTDKTDSHVAVMDIFGMHKLYKTESIYVATPLSGAAKWDGSFRRTNLN